MRNKHVDSGRPGSDDSCKRSHTRGEIDVEVENASLKWAVGGPNDSGLPVEEILANGGSTDVARRILGCKTQGWRAFVSSLRKVPEKTQNGSAAARAATVGEMYEVFSQR